MKSQILRFTAGVTARMPVGLRRWMYRLGPITKLLRRMLNRAAPHGPQIVEVAAGLGAGLKVSLNLQAEKDFWLGTYETDLQQAARDWVKSGDTVYDVGANIGYVSLLLSRVNGPDGLVIAFEALPANLERINLHKGLNNLATRLEIEAMAVVYRSGPVQFQVHNSIGMGKAAGSAGRDEAYEQSLDVTGIALDDYVFEKGRPKPDLIKVDIEGGEVLALPGMARILAEVRPVLFLELHGQVAAETTWNIFAQHNYRLREMAPGYPEIEHLDDMGWKAYVIAEPKAASH